MSRRQVERRQVEGSATDTLHFLLFIKIFLLVSSISLIWTSLLHHSRTSRLATLRAGSILGLVTLVSGLADLLALLGLRLWRRVLLLPLLSCLVLGTVSSFAYVLKSLLLRGGQHGVNTALAALVGTLICSWLFLRILSVFLIMDLPRPQPPSLEAAGQPISTSPTPTNIRPSLDIPSSVPAPSSVTEPQSDNPPLYSSLQDCHCPPSYEDSMVEKMQHVSGNHP